MPGRHSRLHLPLALFGVEPRQARRLSIKKSTEKAKSMMQGKQKGTKNDAHSLWPKKGPVVLYGCQRRLRASGLRFAEPSGRGCLRIGLKIASGHGAAGGGGSGGWGGEGREVAKFVETLQAMQETSTKAQCLVQQRNDSRGGLPAFFLNAALCFYTNVTLHGAAWRNRD